MAMQRTAVQCSFTRVQLYSFFNSSAEQRTAVQFLVFYFAAAAMVDANANNDANADTGPVPGGIHPISHTANLADLDGFTALGATQPQPQPMTGVDVAAGAGLASGGAGAAAPNLAAVLPDAHAGAAGTVMPQAHGNNNAPAATPSQAPSSRWQETRTTTDYKQHIRVYNSDSLTQSNAQRLQQSEQRQAGFDQRLETLSQRQQLQQQRLQQANQLVSGSDTGAAANVALAPGAFGVQQLLGAPPPHLTMATAPKKSAGEKVVESVWLQNGHRRAHALRLAPPGFVGE